MKIKSVQPKINPRAWLWDKCFSDFNNSYIALVIGTDNIDIINHKIIIKGNQIVSRVVLTALACTIARTSNDMGYFTRHQATSTPIQISTDDTQISVLLWRMKTYATSPEVTSHRRKYTLWKHLGKPYHYATTPNNLDFCGNQRRIFQTSTKSQFPNTNGWRYNLIRILKSSPSTRIQLTRISVSTT